MEQQSIMLSSMGYSWLLSDHLRFCLLFWALIRYSLFVSLRLSIVTITNLLKIIMPYFYFVILLFLPISIYSIVLRFSKVYERTIPPNTKRAKCVQWSGEKMFSYLRAPGSSVFRVGTPGTCPLPLQPSKRKKRK